MEGARRAVELLDAVSFWNARSDLEDRLRLMTLTSIALRHAFPAPGTLTKPHPVFACVAVSGEDTPFQGHTRGRYLRTASREAALRFPCSCGCSVLALAGWTPILARRLVQPSPAASLTSGAWAEIRKWQHCSRQRPVSDEERKFGLRGESDRHVGSAWRVLDNVVAPRHFAGTTRSLRSGGLDDEPSQDEGFDEVRGGFRSRTISKRTDCGHRGKGQSRWSTSRELHAARRPTMPYQRKNRVGHAKIGSEIVQD